MNLRACGEAGKSYGNAHKDYGFRTEGKGRGFGQS